jgi:hypothetical protein
MDGQTPNVRCSPERFLAAVHSFTPTQRQWVNEMGFGPLLEMQCQGVERRLCLWLMNRFNPATRELEIRANKFVRIYDNHVGWVLGIPRRKGRYVPQSENREALQGLKALYGNNKGICETIVRDLMVACEDEAQFKQHFLLYTLGLLLCPTQNIKFSPLLLKVCADPMIVMDTWSYNWAQYVLDWLVGCARKYKHSLCSPNGKSSGSGVGGCVLFVQV